MKIDIPAGAIQIGQSEDGRLAVFLTGEGLEGLMMLDPKVYTSNDAQELGAMLWRVCERWTTMRREGKA